MRDEHLPAALKRTQEAECYHCKSSLFQSYVGTNSSVIYPKIAVRGE